MAKDTLPFSPGEQSGQPSPLPGTIADYRIIDILGQGGMGIVYRAEQPNPKRIVALKVIGRPFITSEMLRRFEHESQTLARLKHPGIAQVYEAGLVPTEHGPQPFFAMELVEGIPLDAYSEQKKLSIRDRLELLTKICDAVQYAHQQSVIHRDLKPDNILVTADGQPKILDFGVARVTDTDVQTTTMHTDVAQLIGTLPYMSPEQAGGNVDQVDTRSDVYALGVIAYELLSGKLPYDISKRMIHEAVRVIQEEEPSRLSSINKTFRGDIETIIAKALAKEKDRRYPSVSALAADIRRYLTDEPITARPASTWYQVRKFTRRNRVLVAGIAAVFVALLAGAIGTYGMYRRAEFRRVEAQERRADADKQAAIARAADDFLAQMLSAADPTRMLGKDVTVLQATREAIIKLGNGHLADQPLVEASVRATIGNTLQSLDQLVDAEQHLRRALELRRLYSPRDEDVIRENTNDLAIVLQAEGKLDEAASLLIGILSPSPGSPARTDLSDDQTLANLAGVRASQGDLAEAEGLLRRSLDARRARDGSTSPTLLTLLSNLAGMQFQQGKYQDAETSFREILKLRRQSLPPEHPDLAGAMSQLSLVLAAQDKLTEADVLLAESLRIQRARLPETHTDIRTSLTNLAELRRHQHRPQQAVDLLKEVISLTERSRATEHPELAIQLSNLATLLKRLGRPAEARPLLDRAISIVRKSLPADHPYMATCLGNLGTVCHDLGDLPEAERCYVEAVRICKKSLPPGHVDTANQLNNLAQLYLFQRRFAEAEKLLAESLDIYNAALPAGHPAIAHALNNLAGAQRAAGRLEDAHRNFELALAQYRKSGEQDQIEVAMVLNNLAELALAGRDLATAESLNRDALGIYERELPAQHPDIASSLSNLATTLADQGKWTEAEQTLTRALAIQRASLPSGHEDIATTLGTLAYVLGEQGRYEAAEPIIRECLDISRKVYPAGDPRMIGPVYGVAYVLQKEGKYADAEPLFREALALHVANSGVDSPQARNAAESLASTLDQLNRNQEATTLRSEFKLKTSTSAPTTTQPTSTRAAN